MLLHVLLFLLLQFDYSDSKANWSKFRRIASISIALSAPVITAASTHHHIAPITASSSITTHSSSNKNSLYESSLLISSKSESSANVYEPEPEQLKETVDIVINDAEEVYEALISASMSGDLNSLIASTAAQGLAGVIAAGASRTTANILQDKKKDNIVTKLSTTGIFFSSRAFFRTILKLCGVPRPLSLLFGSLLGSYLAELAKVISRDQYTIHDTTHNTNYTYTNTTITAYNTITTIRDLSNLFSPNSTSRNVISLTEVYADVAKWLVYDELEEYIPLTSSDFPIQAISYFIFGSIATIISYLIKSTDPELYSEKNSEEKVIILTDSERNNQVYNMVYTTNNTYTYASIYNIHNSTDNSAYNTNNIYTYNSTTNTQSTPHVTPPRIMTITQLQTLTKEIIEGGILFSCYQIFLKLSTSYLDPNIPILNFELPFHRLLMEAEKGLNSDILLQAPRVD